MFFNIWNRRYIGNKYKIVNWIKKLIVDNCTGSSFTDLFAGTGVLSYNMLDSFKTIHINDILFSNEIIYKAFFDNSSFNLDKLISEKDYFNSLNLIYDNYVSYKFGNKYFSMNDSKKIGYIREHIEINKSKYNNKEYNILLSSLLFSFDKIANTVGHYDAYIKNKKIEDRFQFELINPYNTSKNNVFIYREYANDLAYKLENDIVYIDPPYNSRQYSRFYHILENIALWQKPELFGEALKPKPENMSDYCRVSAKSCFEDLINNLKSKYIVVSYNNTYFSKSNSSKNKIHYDDICNILENKGELKIFEQRYKFFNSGKTNFNDHKEYLFIVKVF